MGKYVGWLETTPTFKCQMFIPPTMRFYKSTLRNYMYVVLFTHEYRTQQQYKIEIFNFNYSNVILTSRLDFLMDFWWPRPKLWVFYRPILIWELAYNRPIIGKLNVFSFLKLQVNSLGFLKFAAMCSNLRPFDLKDTSGYFINYSFILHYEGIISAF